MDNLKEHYFVCCWIEEGRSVCCVYDREDNDIVCAVGENQEEAALKAKKKFNSIVKREYFPIEE